MQDINMGWDYSRIFDAYVECRDLRERVIVAVCKLEHTFGDQEEDLKSKLKYILKDINHVNDLLKQNSEKSLKISKRLLMTKKSKDAKLAVISRDNVELQKQKTELQEKQSELNKQNASVQTKLKVLDDFKKEYCLSYLNGRILSSAMANDSLESDPHFKALAQSVIERFEADYAEEIQAAKEAKESEQKQKEARFNDISKILDN